MKVIIFFRQIFDYYLYKKKDNFFSRSHQVNGSLFRKYIESLMWAVSTMTGSSFGDVTPFTNFEILISTIMMVLGASFYAKIFADFVSMISFVRSDRQEKKL